MKIVQPQDEFQKCLLISLVEVSHQYIFYLDFIYVFIFGLHILYTNFI